MYYFIEWNTQKYVQGQNLEAEARKSGEPRKPLIGRLRLRLIFKMGFNPLNNPIRSIGLVLPRLIFTALGCGSGQSQAKAGRHRWLWPGLRILNAQAVKSQAKAAAFRPSRAGTLLF
jgi:hypothetical protein